MSKIKMRLFKPGLVAAAVTVAAAVLSNGFKWG